MNRKLITIIITGLIIEVLCVAIASIGDIKKNIPCFAFLYVGSFIAYIFAVFYVLKNAEITKQDENGSRKILWTVIAFALIFRLTLLPMTPSGDMYRYLWEGKLQLNWVNPYSHPPESSNLEHLRDDFFSGITHKHLTTIYPPLTLMAFAIADFISHSFISMKSIFLVFDVLSIFLLLRFLSVMGKDSINVLIYAWSPLVLISFAARGHCDSLQIFFVILALYLYAIRKNLRSVISIGLAAISKFIFIIIAPFLIPGKKFKYVIVLFSVIVVLYLPYVGAGKGLFSTLFHFWTQYHFNDSAHFLIFCLCIGSPLASKIITSMIFGSVLLYLYKKNLKLLITDGNENSPQSAFSKGGGGRVVPPFLKGDKGGFRGVNDSVLNFAFLSVGAFLILTPTLHPWYLTWIIPFLCFNKNRAWLILTGTVVFYYFMNHELFSKLILYNNEWVWKEVHWLKLPEYVPFYGLLIYGWLVKKNFALRPFWLNRNLIGGRN
ncbi:MAG: hypothetical protein SCARUB_03526 [Candidatus Scalindua rubra]|uniref:Glycosyltransferase RgtA/B/C/D-like domain-containing protein n=1 Tax=Candidatus Scalindua rubra TaxID=1872076 RepID=A0A1E3X732_9BACT|nr:MAG: hypothetical protein SCARUB_03526 [Candidatus Scalindua rubra]